VTTLTIAASLASLVSPQGPDEHAAGSRTLELDADDWSQLVAALRSRFPRLADWVLTPSDTVRAGFLIAVNDDVVPGGGRPPRIRRGDQVLLFPQIAGG